MNLLYSDKIDQFIYLEQCNSTNDYAINTLSNNDPKQNTCVYTFNQTAGRGQIGRSWYSGSCKNLTTTFRFPLSGFLAKDQFLLNITFALAIKDFISTQIKEVVSIKWPNDIYVGDRKIAGILIQNNLRGTEITSTILGVGINVFEDAFPEELPNPISIYQLNKLSGIEIADGDKVIDKEAQRTGMNFKLTHLLASVVIDRFSNLSANRDKYKEEYLSALYLLNQEAKFTIDGNIVAATIRGVNDWGKLELELNGQRRLFAFRELAYVLPNSSSKPKG